MKGKVNSIGRLIIVRGNKTEQEQWCPFADDLSCGDWCPLFGEPKIPNNSRFTVLDICQGRTLTFEKFEDERGAP